MFLQVADGTGLLGSARDFFGENCAEILQVLLDDGLVIDESRVVRGRVPDTSGARDIVVWDLIRE